ncbi:MAG: histidine kinase, partial [Parafilimonas terrae]|nr:histidine kinase [Parafilimonas terrae]
PPTLPTREGFGTRLLNKILTAQVAAEVEIDFDDDGLRIDVRLPLGLRQAR